MRVGTRVLILDKYEYDGKFYGMTGTVVHAHNGTYFGGTSKIAVQIDNVDNPRSKYNGYWFHSRRCKELNDKPVQLISGYRVARVRAKTKLTDAPIIFPAAAYLSDNFKQGDYAIMKENNQYIVAEVMYLTDDYDEPVPFGRELIAKCNFQDFFERQRLLERNKELKTQLQEHIGNLTQDDILTILSEHDPEIDSMLTELRSLQQEIPTLKGGYDS